MRTGNRRFFGLFGSPDPHGVTVKVMTHLGQFMITNHYTFFEPTKKGIMDSKFTKILAPAIKNHPSYMRGHCHGEKVMAN